MEDRANRSSHQTNNNVVDTTTLVHSLALLNVSSQHVSEKDASSEPTNCFLSQSGKRVKLWHQPSVRPIVRKERLKGRKRSKKFAKRSKLTFNKDVLVFEIPSLNDYSAQDKSLIWRSEEEIARDARRNIAEFENEGEDWRNVVDDEDMYEDEDTGEMVHPCWVECDDSPWEVFSDDDDTVAC